LAPLFIVGTKQDIGKTTTSIGLLSAFRRRGFSVGYIKPLGQRIKGSAGYIVHDDARLIASILGREFDEELEMPIPLPSGRVEKEVYDLDTSALFGKARAMYERLADRYEIVVIEGMGHVAAGSCLGLSAAEVSKGLGAKTLLISGGGIGRALDEISLCATFLTARGAPPIGVSINKVWREKYDRVKRATAAGLEHFGLRCFGVVPYEELLASPTMHQAFGYLKDAELLAGQEHLGNRVRNIIVAAMETENMVKYISRGTLVITPGDRSDNIHAALSAHMLGEHDGKAVAGIILTGGIAPTGSVRRMIDDARLPVVISSHDTYKVASKLRETVFKITPDDPERIDRASRIMEEYLDVDAILELLRG